MILPNSCSSALSHKLSKDGELASCYPSLTEQSEFSRSRSAALLSGTKLSNGTVFKDLEGFT